LNFAEPRIHSFASETRYIKWFGDTVIAAFSVGVTHTLMAVGFWGLVSRRVFSFFGVHPLCPSPAAAESPPVRPD
jgi:hypothetical protein